MGLKERLLDYLTRENIEVAAFERRVGLSNGAVYKMGDNTRKSTLDKISVAYPDLDMLWLRNGEIGKATEERADKTITVTSDKINNDYLDGTPIYDIDATCGADNREMEFAEEKIIGSINVPEISRDSKIISASGDSMLPLIASGDRVVIREIQSWDYFNYGQVYLVLTEEYRLIKRVRRHADSNFILLRSDNPDYDDIDLPKSEIRKLFIVENILSIKNIL